MASRQRKAVNAAFGKLLERGMRRLTLRVYQAVTVGTPVRFGFARAGWTPSTGQPDRSSPTDPPSLENLARAQASALFTTHQQAANLIASGYKVGQGPTFIVNPVRYIRPLNEGSSAQAPQMFVELAIAIAVKATIRELRG